MSAEDARRRKNPANKKGYSNVIVHHSTVPCKNFSPYNLKTSKDVMKVNCITCKRILTNQGKFK